MKKTRSTILLIALVLVMSLAACNQDSPDPGTQPTTEPTAAPTTEPTTAPTEAPTTEPTTAPTTEPTTEPTEPPTEPVITKMPSSPFGKLFNRTDSMQVSVQLSDGTTSETITLFTKSTDFSLGAYAAIDEPDTAGCSEWIHFSSGDGVITLTVYHGTTDYLRYEENGYVFWYENADATTEQNLRRVFDTMEYNSMKRLSFACDGTAAQAMQKYAETVFGEFRMNLTGGSLYKFTDYKLDSVTVSTDNGSTVEAKMKYYFKTEHPNGKYMFAAALPGEGTYEGWHWTEETVALEKQSDGLWYVISSSDLRVAENADDNPYAAGKADQNAVDFLETVPGELAAIRENQDETAVLELAKLFCKTVTALPQSGSIEYDWSAFCTEDALDHVGMRSLSNLRLNNKNYSAHALGSLDKDMSFEYVVIRNGQAIAYNSHIQIYFVMTDSGWFIDDICQPFAGT